MIKKLIREKFNKTENFWYNIIAGLEKNLKTTGLSLSRPE